MNATELTAWRRRFGWTQEQAAPMLGRSLRQYRHYETGLPIPREIALAVLALEIVGHAPAHGIVRHALGRLGRAAALPHASAEGIAQCETLDF